MADIPTDPLAMAQNAAAFVALVADMQASDDPDVQLRAHVHQAGRQGMDSAMIAGAMALVAIAGDIRRIADALTAEGGPGDG